MRRKKDTTRYSMRKFYVHVQNMKKFWIVSRPVTLIGGLHVLTIDLVKEKWLHIDTPSGEHKKK